MDGIIFFTIFSMGFALPIAIGAFGIAAGIVFLACMAYVGYSQKRIERNHAKLVEELGYDTWES